MTKYFKVSAKERSNFDRDFKNLIKKYSNGLSASEFVDQMIKSIKSYEEKVIGEDGVDYTGAYSNALMTALKNKI